MRKWQGVLRDEVMKEKGEWGMTGWQKRVQVGGTDGRGIEG